MEGGVAADDTARVVGVRVEVLVSVEVILAIVSVMEGINELKSSPEPLS